MSATLHTFVLCFRCNPAPGLAGIVDKRGKARCGRSAAYTLSQTGIAVNFYFTYSALGVATAAIHSCTVTRVRSKFHFALLRIVFGRIRDGAFTSKLGFEVVWLSFMWLMWLSTGGQTAATLGLAVNCIDSCVYFFTTRQKTLILKIHYGLRSDPDDRHVWVPHLNHA